MSLEGDGGHAGTLPKDAKTVHKEPES